MLTFATRMTMEAPSWDRLTLYGKLTGVVCVVRNACLCDGILQMWAVVLEGAMEPAILVSTALSRTALQRRHSPGAAPPAPPFQGCESFPTVVHALHIIPLL